MGDGLQLPLESCERLLPETLISLVFFLELLSAFRLDRLNQC